MLHQLEAQVSTNEATELAEVLAFLGRNAQYALPGNLLGLYLVGSFALGTGDVYSDVDFVVVTKRSLTAVEERKVRDLHAKMPDSPSHWARNLEGSYVSADGLRPGAQGHWLYVDNGSREMEWSRHDNTAVFRWVLRERGISILGPAPTLLADPVDEEELRREAAHEAAARATALLSDPTIFANAWGQTHVVTMFCRLLYTVDTGGVAGKVAAVQWAITSLPARWHELMFRAVSDRPNPWARVHQVSDPELRHQMPMFVKFIATEIGRRNEQASPDTGTAAGTHPQFRLPRG